ncbi:MAG TPA: Gfo/Idh/MocA family oxidoreductase [archaeon]|nr:Gfo/Idh/MocA family oxidoreductase [archaeon]
MESMDRRKFIKRAGTSAVGLVAAGPFIKSGFAKDSPNDRVNVAVMGIRSRGQAHAEDLARLKNVDVTVLCDIDERLFPETVALVEKVSGKKPRTETDIRKVLEDKDVHAISIASPNHWHALAAIWACQAGKDVYVEKPVSHNIREGRKIVEAARKYNRIVQTGTQSRSSSVCQTAMEFLHSGGIGELYMARSCLIKARDSFGRAANSPVPPGVHYDLWLGPAPWRPFNEKRFHYNWHWFWDTGNGETGNTGPHNCDRARWGLQEYEHPRKIQSLGGMYLWKDCDQETPNHQVSVMEYPDGKIIQLEVRGHYSNSEEGILQGEFFYGSEGWLKLGGNSWQSYFGRKNEPGKGMGSDESKAQAEKLDLRGTGGSPHFQNFIDCVRSRRQQDLAADILEGHLSTAMCHLCNIAYRTGQTLVFDSENEKFVGEGEDEAEIYLSREYRYPYVVPENV